MSELDLRLLGPPLISHNGEPLSVDTRKAVAILVYLAVRNELAQRDSLVALLWPESDSSRGKAALRRTLSTLNKGLSGEWLEVTRETVKLETGEGLSVDVHEYVSLIAESKDHAVHHPATCAECIARLTRAVELYRGDFLAGFTLRDSPSFDEWEFFQTDGYRSKLDQALEMLIGLHTTRREFDRSIELARRRIAIDGLHEAAHRQLMELYHWSGQRTAALRQYRECVRVLDEELKVPPLEETTDLYELILQNELPRLPSESMAVTATGAEKPPLILRSELPKFIGRDQEQSILTSTFEASRDGGRFVVIAGEMGIGKTRLADHFLKSMRLRGAITIRATCFPGETGLSYAPFVEALREAVNLESTLRELPSRAQSEIARLLPEFGAAASAQDDLNLPGAKIRFFETVSGVIHQLLEGPHPGLLFFDDVQYADDASLDLLTYFVRRMGTRPILVMATWNPEELGGKVRLVDLLSDTQRSGAGSIITLPRFNPLESAALIGEMMDQTPSKIAPLTERLHRASNGIPFFLVEYLTEFQGRELQALDESLTIPETLRALLRLRLGGISETGLQLLAAASVIGSPFEYHVLRDVAGRGDEETVHQLELFTSKWLLEEGEPHNADQWGLYRFRYEILRQFIYNETNLARRKLLHRRTAEVLLKRAKRAAERASGIAYHLMMADELEEALEYYVIAGDHARSIYANQEAIEHYQSALSLNPPDPSAIHEKMGDLNTRLGKYREAIQNFEAAQAYDGDHDRSRIERKLGVVYQRKGDWSLAESHFETALDRSSEAVEKPLILSEWAYTVYRAGDAKRAKTLAQQALDSVGGEPESLALAQALNMLGMLYRNAGDEVMAEEQFHRSLALARELDDPGAQIAALNNLALTLADKDLHPEALKDATAALTLSQQIGDRHQQAAIHSNIADLYHAMDKSVESLDHLRQSAEIYAEIGVEGGQFEPEIWKLMEW